LQIYIKNQNKKIKKFWGGIVIEDKDSFRYNHDDEYNYVDGEEINWEILSI
jgi:hypothetical protein